MKHDTIRILAILDECCDACTFPMLDNGYIYPAATRLSLFRSPEDWALVVEIFGFSPRAGLPDTAIYTFASRLANRKAESQWVNRAAYENYLRNNPYNELRFVGPIAEGAWQDSDDVELMADQEEELILRGECIRLPSLEAYGDAGVELAEGPRTRTFELCRALAHGFRDLVLATAEERRFNVPSELQLLLSLDEWSHPNLLNDELPSDSSTFRQFARVLVSGDPREYRPVTPPNTHWRNWPLAGTL